MARTLLIRGMLVGVVAAVVAFVVAQLLGESQIDLAIAFETSGGASEAAGHAHGAAVAGGGAEEELVSRSTQSGIGLFVGMLAFSVAIGGIFALTYAGLQGRMGTLGARSTAALVALGGFAALYLLPVLKYPANPPAVGDPETIGRRTALYFAMIAISLVVVVGGGVAAKQLSARFGGWDAGLLAAGGGLVLVGLAFAFLPGGTETPEGFPPDVLWDFRVASLAIQASVWATIGLLFGALTERHLRSVAAEADQARLRPAGAASAPV